MKVAVAESATRNKLTDWLLLAGAALGLGAAMWSALGVDRALTKYADAAAIVDGVPIPRSVYDSAIAGLEAAKRNPLTDAEKRQALARIIDEELLLRRAVELGLAESDPTARKALVNAMLQFSIAEAAKLEPTDDDLRRFYTERPKLIAPQPLLTVRAVSLPVEDEARIDRLRVSLVKGHNFERAVAAADATLIVLPTGPVIPSKIAEYAGGTVRDVALGLDKGQTAGPVQIGRRVVFVHLVDRTDAPPPPLEDVRDLVAEEWRKRKTEEAFEAYVAQLRARARITIAPDATRTEPD
jgi:parvulin-like peptidyl-prolyl isomerase